MKLDGFLGNPENPTDLPVRFPLFAPFEAGDFLRRQERIVGAGHFTSERLRRDWICTVAAGQQLSIKLRGKRIGMYTMFFEV
ncbi:MULTISPECIES: hypothetical protein [unclassified Bradyrhizobium]|uniref:hypothetical protein n=1 Tax=unclassified Bradyrhizobium TaxID=2631580 RepID=UPI001CD2BD8E|nr:MULTISPECIES: hypothetical protein [unclassified Bradyrhizobium]